MNSKKSHPNSELIQEKNLRDFEKSHFCNLIVFCAEINFKNSLLQTDFQYIKIKILHKKPFDRLWGVLVKTMTCQRD